eukprot:COSAG06_NODE_9433_length_1902_cov_184.717138_2_plen_100_part_00
MPGVLMPGVTGVWKGRSWRVEMSIPNRLHPDGKHLSHHVRHAPALSWVPGEETSCQKLVFLKQFHILRYTRLAVRMLTRIGTLGTRGLDSASPSRFLHA